MSGVGPYCPVNKVQLKTSVRVHEVLFNQHTPAIHISPTGRPGSFVPYDNATMITFRRASNWRDVHGITEILIKDVDKCMLKNPDHFVAILGLGDDNAMMTHNTLYVPPKRDPIYPVEMHDHNDLY